MVTAESVKAKLQGLIDLANTTTGNADADLTAAVNSLIAGFGQGGSSGGASGIYMAKVTPASDVSTFDIQHNLNTTDILFALVWAETFGGIEPTTNQAVSNVWLKTDIPVRVTSSYNRENLETANFYNTSTGNINSVNMKTSASYLGEPTDANNFHVKAGTSSSARFYGGVTYTVIIMAASAFSVTEV